ncbi:cilia- and flagella-associated protein 299-like [Drosophila nasuta]|uniref:Cilia- and flagella-associated protein 299 n=1 Tax=Drosophila albomicans TaxID=7291 RepID=A0A6P8WMS2_DROAB|nr:cilia- and flagella-associated protein 299-like [Drosophila albomicans]XP_060662042.1 cilia- and flagella-associated protein 299-like [Drosophila nasuta]
MAANLNLRLLNYKSYDDYLNSFIKTEDYRYIGSIAIIKNLVKLGYRCSDKVYEESEFNYLRNKVHDYLNPKITSVLYGKYFNGTDNALKALMEREEYNLTGILSTIIFVQIRQRNGFDIAGYIDYEQRLRESSLHKPDCTNWKSVFEGKKLIKPKKSDLSYYDWHKGRIYHNSTDNFQTVSGGVGLTFMHKADHKHIPVTDKPSKYSMNVNRVLIPSDLYGNMILYDHFVR